ncbi:hypothetical protein F2Q69_00010373 [Brassica cretica]|uniref:Uncharacterized protein n=1 Tax=Brassica cretica TaxID=69181 RepID=A0A8S9R1S7_BRACR|nr:hypothetical protein F2Q69_00010373 [Brassica cretica]
MTRGVMLKAPYGDLQYKPPKDILQDNFSTAFQTFSLYLWRRKRLIFFLFNSEVNNDDNLVQQWTQKRQKEKKRERKVERRESSSMLLLLRVAYVFNEFVNIIKEKKYNYLMVALGMVEVHGPADVMNGMPL